eukprot:2874644-Amphidinium_carterae.1
MPGGNSINSAASVFIHMSAHQEYYSAAWKRDDLCAGATALALRCEEVRNRSLSGAFVFKSLCGACAVKRLRGLQSPNNANFDKQPSVC